MPPPGIKATPKGDQRYYKRAANFSFVWNLQHGPRKRLVGRFMELMRPAQADRLLDLGTAALPEPMENVLECLYPWPERITAVGSEDCSFLEERHPGLKFVRVVSGRPLPFADDAFDLGFCNAVIEHVGSRRRQAAFLAELIRVSRRVFLSTPNRWYPLELHTRLPFVHWLPASLFRRLIAHLGFDFYAREANLNLLTARELKGILPPGNFRVRLLDHYFLGLPSNIILVVEK
jgi:hypothetical protein